MTESRSSDRRLKPLPPNPARHQDSAIARANDYMLEAGGVTHAPASDEGALMIAIFHGPLQITGPDGRVEVVVGIDELYALAEANNAVGHLPPKPARP